MDKQALVRDIKSSYGGAGLISQAEVGKYINLKPEATRKFVEGMDFCTLGKKKLYAVTDVAERILECRG